MAIVADIEGEVAECRTRLTSFWPSADHKSTVRTKYAVSMSLSEMELQQNSGTSIEHLLNEIEVC